MTLIKPDNQKNLRARKFFWQMICAFVVLTVVISADLFSKSIIAEISQGWVGRSLTVIEGFFYIRYTTNKGAAWSIGAGNEAFIMFTIIAAIVMVLACIVIIFSTSGKVSYLFTISISLMASGALGNLIDRIMLGEVRDFLSFILFGSYSFPIFNIADSALVISMFLLAFWLFFLSGKDKSKNSSQKEQTDG